MNLFCLVFCVVLVKGLTEENPRVKRTSNLLAPSITSLKLFKPANVEVTWTAVESGDLLDPVIAYKLKVWEIPNVIKYQYEKINGVMTLVEKSQVPKISADQIPTSFPQEYTTNGTSFLVQNLKPNIEYQFRVQVFTETKESSLSSPSDIRILSAVNE